MPSRQELLGADEEDPTVDAEDQGGFERGREDAQGERQGYPSIIERSQMADQQGTSEDETPDEFADFEELTEDELDALIDDDPQEALRYQRKLDKYKKAKATKDRAALSEIADINLAVDEIEAMVPGIWEQDSDINKSLTQFAVDNGFDINDLAVLTNPSTKIVPPGGKRPVVLGKGAASVIKMIHNLYKASGKGGSGTARSRSTSGKASKTPGDSDEEQIRRMIEDGDNEGLEKYLGKP